MILATTELHNTSRVREKENLQWHSQGSVMYVLIDNRQEIDFRMDREIYDFKVSSIWVAPHSPITYFKFQDPETVDDSGIIFFTMLFTRPLEWATGTDFDPSYDDANKIAIRLDLTDSDDKEEYDSLVQWIGCHTPTDDTMLTLENVTELWQSLSECVSMLYLCSNIIHHSS